MDILITDSTPASQIVTASSLTLNLARPPIRFYHHGWQSWTLAAWIDPTSPVIPVRAAEFRLKDEDPVYSLSGKHTSAWVAAADLGGGETVLLGGLGLGARIQLDGNSMVGFYEAGEGDWLIARGDELSVFRQYAEALKVKHQVQAKEATPRVWCSWYSLYGLINERVLRRTIHLLGDLPFDVIQIDDGWEVSTGDWVANKKFPSGMADLAARIKDTGRKAGLWLSPLIVTREASLFREHPDWLLKNEQGAPVFTGQNWSGKTYALDVTHPAVLDWLGETIRAARGWGYDYFKLDFLYAGAFPGRQHTPTPREEAYQNALRVIREAAGEAYILACGAPILPSLKFCDGIRIGTDVTPYWINTPLSTWLSNPNNPSTQNAIRTCIHRQWLRPLIHLDPDAAYFRARHTTLTASQKQLLSDLALVSGFKVSSDLPQWMTPKELDNLRAFLESNPVIEQVDTYRYRADGREIDFSPAISIPLPNRLPVWLATNLGILQMGIQEVLPAFLETRRDQRIEGR